MKLLLLCILFAPIIFLALKEKKWYLYLLVAFIGVLPEQFAIELHDKIPLLSGSRLLILCLTAFWLYDKWKTKKISLPKSLLLYFAVNVIISLVNLRYGMDEIKRIFLLVFERVLLVIMIADMIADREEFDRCIDFMIMGCSALAVIGIVQTVFEYDFSSVLHLQETLASISISTRMGLTRAYGTYNAISYGCYCAFMILPITYRLYNEKKIWHSIAFSLNFVALICTFTRSAWLCIAGIFLVILFVYRTKLIRKMLSSAGLAVLLCIILCFCQPKLFNAFLETGKSTVNTILGILPDSVISMFVSDEPNAPGESSSGDENEDMPQSGTAPGFELSEDFGMNGEDPTYSRTAQWTAVEYMSKEGQLLFGYGYNALAEGRIHFFYDRWSAKWHPTTYLDVGLVALITEGGLIGALSYLGLLCYMFVYAFRKRAKDESKPFDFYRVTIYTIPLYLLLNYLAAFLSADAVWLFFAMFYAYKRLDELPERSISLENTITKQSIPHQISL